MTEYNEGARGRVRYWMERAQRAEAECERLRRTLGELVEWTENRTASLGAYPSILDEAKEALATPPPEGEQWEYYYKRKDCPARYATDPHCICWHPEGTGPRPNERHDDAVPVVEWRKAPAHRSLGDAPHTPEQSHGDALALFDEYAERGCWFWNTYERQDAIEKIRAALTASGVPEIDGLPPLRQVFEIARSRFQKLAEYHDPMSVPYGIAATGVKGCNEALRALAAAPSDGGE